MCVYVYTYVCMQVRIYADMYTCLSITGVLVSR